MFVQYEQTSLKLYNYLHDNNWLSLQSKRRYTLHSGNRKNQYAWIIWTNGYFKNHIEWNWKEKLKKAWINKYKALEKDLQEVCKKHGAVLLKGDSLYEAVDAPYAEELNVDFCFGIDLEMEGTDDIEFKESDWEDED